MAASDLIIIGGGAAGLMAGVCAGEAGLSAIVLERRHRPGQKLLMCGNNRCNVSHAGNARKLADDYGGLMGSFLLSALNAFPPAALMEWFAANGLRTMVKRSRIYPESENADDVLHCFMDKLRLLKVPLSVNSPVASVEHREDDAFDVRLENGFSLTARNVLVATGGVSFPKTGSVGDGLKFATALHHKVTPLRAGLAGMEIGECWMNAGRESDIEETRVRLEGQDGTVCVTEGNILCAGNILRGSAIFDAVRLAAHQNITNFRVYADLFPSRSERELEALLGNARSRGLVENLQRLGLPVELCSSLAGVLGRLRGSWGEYLKNMPVPVTGIRPLKEAIVTVGGVSLEQINPETMESKICPGLYFSGEVMDVDGPTGGYNLHAAFATARLAVQSIAEKQNGGTRAVKGKTTQLQQKRPWNQNPKDRYGDPRTRSKSFDGNDRKKRRY